MYTHKKFSVSFNDARIIQVGDFENPVTLSTGTQLDFTYSVEWKPTTTSFHRRFDRYLDYDFFEHQIHWFSVAARPNLRRAGILTRARPCDPPDDGPRRYSIPS